MGFDWIVNEDPKKETEKETEKKNEELWEL